MRSLGLLFFAWKIWWKPLLTLNRHKRMKIAGKLLSNLLFFVPNFLRCMLSFWSNKKTMDSRQCKTIMKSVRSFKWFEVPKIYPCFLAGFKFLFAFFCHPILFCFSIHFIASYVCLSPYLVLFANPFSSVCQPILFCFFSSKFCLPLLFATQFCFVCHLILICLSTHLSVQNFVCLLYITSYAP